MPEPERRPSEHGALRRRDGDPRPASVRRAAFEILQAVEAQPLAGIVTIASEGAVHGELVVAGGRVCLATSRAPGPPPPIPTALRDLARAARGGGSTLGLALERRGEAAIEAIRQEVRDFVARTLLGIARVAAAGRVTARFTAVRGEYEQRLTFRPVELYVAACALDASRCDRDAARGLFESRASHDEPSMLLRRGGAAAETLPVPIATRTLDGDALRDVVALARLFGEAMRPPAQRPDLVPTYAIARRADRRWVCVATPDHVVALARPEREPIESLLAAMLAALR